MAKKYLEIAFNDYLLNDNYWRASIRSHLNTTPVEFAEQINELPQQSEVVE